MKFKDLYKARPGQKIDLPETLTTILKYEEGTPVNYITPFVHNGPINNRYLGDKPRHLHSGVFKTADRYVFSISDAAIMGQQGFVYDTAKRCFINEAAKEWVIDVQQSAYANALKLPPLAYLKGTTISFLTIGADSGFYHFLFESLTKTTMYADVLAYADYLLFNGPPLEWKIKWIEKAGIDTSKIIWVNNESHYQCEQLIFTNALTNDQQPGEWIASSLTKIFGIKLPSHINKPKKVLWISRKGLVRAINWEDHLLDGFGEIEHVDLATLSVDDTITKFQQATHIIAPHGAGLSNIYLCQPDTKILELYPAGHPVQPCYYRLSSVCGLKHHIAYLNFADENDNGFGLAFLKQLLENTIFVTN